jgi:SAM-dependent methyltransferase
MCNSYCIDFVNNLVGRRDVENKDVLELGSYDVNGTVRPYLESLKPASYVGVDIMAGPGVDVVCDAADLLNHFRPATFDVVVTTEMLEHVRDWRRVIYNVKRVVKPGGLIVLTTRSRGFPLHDYPGDFWRYEPEDMRVIFADCELLKMERDEADPGIFVAVRIPKDPGWEPLDLSGWALWSIHSDTRRLDAEEEPPAPAATLDDLNRVLEVVNTLQHDLAALREDQSRHFAEAQAAIEGTGRAEPAKRAAEAEVARVKSEINALHATRTFRWTASARRLYSRMLILVRGERPFRS